jgi:hypothetical protein
MVMKKGLIKDVPEGMELENLMQQLNSDNRNKRPISFQIINAVRLKMKSKKRRKNPREKDGRGKSREQYV